MIRTITILFFTFCSIQLLAQDTAKKTSKVKIAIFCPLQLDEVFSGNTFAVSGNSLPKNILPGLEFYNGIMMAVDSLEYEKANAEILIFDTKSKTESIDSILKKPIWKDVDFIIASFKERAEIKPLADFATKKNIPLISATYPNDGGVASNSTFVLINSTLKTHCEGLQKYIQKNYASTNLVYVKRKGNMEDVIQNYFTQADKATTAKYKVVELIDSFNNSQLYKLLDSTKQNIVVCGSMNENFGVKIVKALSLAKQYNCTAVGMPTWDAIKEFSKIKTEKNRSVEIVYSTPYNFSRTEKVGLKLTAKYKAKFSARISDWAFKGFETVYHFANLFLKYPSSFMQHLSSNEYKIFNDFDFQPIKLKKENTDADYLENKKLYFVKMVDGVVKSVN